jgi:hypothetical protein
MGAHMSISYAERLIRSSESWGTGGRYFERLLCLTRKVQAPILGARDGSKANIAIAMALLVLSIVAVVGAACGQAPPHTPDELDSAREALTSYFSLLQGGHYTEAIHYYGGDYEILRGWNPDVAGDDYATLFERGCTANGLMCLQMGKVVDEEQVSPSEFRFVVEFVNEDGTPFVLGPCCGATEEEMPPRTEFTFRVTKVDNRFLVQDLPVYVA